ncbi:MAG TPA: amidohydrolase family protein [Acidimicrobiia bacterium]|nr:amidohydrolase family protein [Acidimicrobiia bacterium]
MNQAGDLKIDAFCHILPRPFFDRVMELPETAESAGLRQRISKIPALHDLEVRLGQLEEFGDGYRQILSMAAPPVEDLGPPEVSVELAKVANESQAELVRDHQERFAGFVACVPVNDVDASLTEIDRAVNDLGALGIQIYTHVNGEPYDRPRFLPLFEKMAELDKMIWIHPSRNANWPDYPTEDRSLYEIWWAFGWPYDTATLMARLVFSGVLERHPHLKMLVHHGGSMVPHFSGRVGPGWDQLGARTPPDRKSEVEHQLTKRPLDYFKLYYGDTALMGAQHAIRCALEFFGADQMLFASDSPYDPEKGPGFIRETIANLDGLDISEEDRRKIYSGNAIRLFGLEV